MLIGVNLMNWGGFMIRPMKIALAAAAAISLSHTPGFAQPMEVPAGPMGGCPPGYHLGQYGQQCHLNQGRPLEVPAGPMGGCPPGYHLGQYGQQCHLNQGRPVEVPAGPMGGCPPGYTLGRYGQQCHLNPGS